MAIRGSKWFVLKITKLFVMVFSFVFAFSISLPYVINVFAAAPPNIITYQGRVLNSNGVPVSSASETMIFELYDSLSGGSCLWSNSSATCATAAGRSVTLTDGLFSENLGDTGDSYAAISDSVFGNNAGVYLQITIGGETLSPRKRITAAPYAINSQTLDGLSSADFNLDQIYDNDVDHILNVDTNDLEFSLDGIGFDFIVDLQSTGDFILHDAGSPFLTVNDNQSIDYATSLAAGNLFEIDADSLTTGTVFDISSQSPNLTTANLFRAFHLATYTSDPGDVSGEIISGLRTITYNDVGNDLNVTGAIMRLQNSIIQTAGTVNDSAIILDINQNNTGSTGSVIDIQNSGEGVALNIAQTGNNSAVAISSTASSSNSLSLFHNNASATGSAVYVQNLGLARGFQIVQNTVDDQAGTGVGNQALVIDVNEAANSDEVIVIRSDADGTPDTEYRFENDGDAFADGAWAGAGADYAEYFSTSDADLLDGEVVCQDNSTAGLVKRCAAGEANVVGVISNNPSFVANVGGAEGSHENNPSFALVGLMGQIETKVTTAEGAVAVGDPIAASSSVAGFGAKAHGPAAIIGFALDPLPLGTGTIRVLVNPQWYAGDVFDFDGSGVRVSKALALNSIAAATASNPGQNSKAFTLRGSGWNGVAAETVGMTLETDVTDSNDYRLSIQNNTSEVAFISESGDLAISGRLYPSNEGILQTNKYIYYEGAGDYMRTNAAGWATGSYDFAEMFPSTQALAAGEVVVFGTDSESVMRSSGQTYDQKIAGIVSTRPGFLAGENRIGNVPIALAGRVPTFVSAENGAIAPGDPLTTSSLPGYAMKATEAGPIVGYAMESLASGTGSIVVFVDTSYYDGGSVSESPAAYNAISGVSSVSSLDITGNLNMNGGSIINVSSIAGFSSRWRIEENGDLYTFGRLIHLINSYQNQAVETFATVSTQTTIQLSGTVELVDGNAAINFEQIDPAFNDIISTTPDYRVFLTADAPTGSLYAINRTVSGFSIRESGSDSNATVDWMVVATHKDFEPIVSEVLEDNIATTEEATIPEVVIQEEVVVEAPIEEPTEPGASEPQPEITSEAAIP